MPRGGQGRRRRVSGSAGTEVGAVDGQSSGEGLSEEDPVLQDLSALAAPNAWICSAHLHAAVKHVQGRARDRGAGALPQPLPGSIEVERIAAANNKHVNRNKLSSS